MKKSLIGMLLLGIMILTRALLIEDVSDMRDAFSREANSDSIDESNSLVALNDIDPKSTFLFKERELKSIKNQVNTVEEIVQEEEIEEDVELIASIENEASEEEDVIPMDYVSNTGYGSWKVQKTETVKEDFNKESYPLDRGNTITDNMSKLFPPRTPH